MYAWYSCGSNSSGLLFTDAAGNPGEDRSSLLPCLLPPGSSPLISSRHSIIHGDNDVHVSGSNEQKQCDPYSTDVHVSFQTSALLKEATCTGATWQHTAAGFSNGRICTFGGKFGSATVVFHTLPDAGACRVSCIACTESSIVCVTETGQVYGWGTSKHGLLPRPLHAGQAQPHPQGVWLDSPTLLAVYPSLDGSAASTSTSTAGTRITRVVAGWRHVAASTADSNVITWGCNKWGQCGRAAMAVEVQPQPTSVEDSPLRTSPTCLPDFIPVPLVHTHSTLTRLLSCCSTCVVVVDSTYVYSWGRGDLGQLGRPLPPVSSAGPDTGTASGAGTLIDTDSAVFDHLPGRVQLRCRYSDAAVPIRSVSCGAEHCVAILDCNKPPMSSSGGSGRVATECQGCNVAWGWNEHGNLGTGDKINQYVPTYVSLHNQVSPYGLSNHDTAGQGLTGVPVEVQCGGAVTMIKATTLA